MKTGKLKLDLDQLEVVSFETQDAEKAQRGTVEGHVAATFCKCSASCDAFETLPVGACSTRCDGTTVTNDTYVDCTWSCGGSGGAV